MLSVSYGTQYLKLKTNLRLAINRLKMAQKKKTEMSIKARVEIADLLSAGKVDRARIRVEHIIREDFIVEGYEILELYCDLLLARFGILEHKTEIDESIGEAVVSILWAVPRIRAEISEFKVVGDQLQIKYGKGLVQAAVNNKIESPVVSPRLIEKMSITAPKKLHVEKYLIEIANKFGIKFKADPEIIQEDEVSLAEKMLIDFCGTANCSAPPPETRPEIGWATCPALHQFHNPNHPSVLNSSIFSPPAPSIKSADSRKHSVTPDDLPLPPMPSPPQAKPELDFDDLMKRFDALKKRN